MSTELPTGRARASRNLHPWLPPALPCSRPSLTSRATQQSECSSPIAARRFHPPRLRGPVPFNATRRPTRSHPARGLSSLTPDHVLFSQSPHEVPNHRRQLRTPRLHRASTFTLTRLAALEARRRRRPRLPRLGQAGRSREPDRHCGRPGPRAPVRQVPRREPEAVRGREWEGLFDHHGQV